MFRTRLLSGIVLVALALVLLITGGPVLAASLLAISIIGLNELYRALGIEDGKFSPLAAVGYLGCFFYYMIVILDLSAYTMTVLIALLILFMAVYVFTYPRYKTDQVTGAFFGVVYVAVMLSCIYELRIMEHGVFLVWLIFISSWGCDTCAYCVGMLFGKHKMSPKLSPKKSVEGAVGGVVGAALIGAIYAAAIAGWMDGGTHTMMSFAVICALGGLISMVGDLAASAIKRNRGIKDYGKLIPGHGGILDRFDSVIFIAPVIYYLAQAFSGVF
ncbi:MAG: phosphatidate cytidylyltransferase [Lachnospiraceae bacterium]|uniref:phosphatidate cytidylyltransferase n=1 Tax=Parablautia sp. Marseille-Q6255 TaxID=3039593 RepID=UPI0024BCD770|nr:phosphatidate cytidylyltransferase [Parablautia sp. Marseille-Q6255]